MSPICAGAAARNMRVRQMHSRFCGPDAIGVAGQLLGVLGHKARSLTGTQTATSLRAADPEPAVLFVRAGPDCRPALLLLVVGGPIRGCSTKLSAEPARKVTGRGKAEKLGNFVQLAFAVGQILLGEFSTYRIDDRCDTLTLGCQVPVKGASMHAKMLGNPIDRTKSAWQQHPDDLARPLRWLVGEVGQLHVQPSPHLAIQRRVCSRDWHVQIAPAANDGIAFL